MNWNSAPTEATKAKASRERAQERRAEQARVTARRRGRIRLAASALGLVLLLAVGWAITSALGGGAKHASATSSSGGAAAGSTKTDSDGSLQSEAEQAAKAFIAGEPKPTRWTLNSSALAAIPADAAVRHATTTKRVVALTFDDGPSEYTAGLLQILKDLRVPATFFVIGRQIQDFPTSVAAENRLGNVVGSHTWAHVDLAKQKKKKGLVSQISDTDTAILDATGRLPTLLRPPYGSTTRKVNTFLRSRDLVPTLWDVDSEDWRGLAPDKILENIMSEVKPGSIILMHDGGGNREPTLAAVPKIVAKLRGQGYTFVTVPVLLDTGPPAASNSSFYMGGG